MSLSFKASLAQAGTRTIVLLPDKVSKELPSRGMNMVEGTVNQVPLAAPVEPDGKGGHWLEFPPELLKRLGAGVGDFVEFEVDILSDWIEPDLPNDLQKKLEDDGLLLVWQDLTTKGRWEWIRWIRSTKNDATRTRRLNAAVSKLAAGDRRPCCFNSAACTVPDVAKSGVLIDLRQACS